MRNTAEAQEGESSKEGMVWLLRLHRDAVIMKMETHSLNGGDICEFGEKRDRGPWE